MSETTATRPTTIEGILKVTGEVMPDFKLLSQSDRKHYEADWIWKQIVKALNKLRDPDWVCDFLNKNQYKHYPWAWLKKDSSKPTGFAFSYTYCSFTSTYTNVGSRLRFADDDDVIFALQNFEQEYIASVIY